MSGTSEVKTDRQYTKEHEWTRAEGGVSRVGISAFAVEQLGDITLVDLNVRVGDKLKTGAVVGTVESVKTLSDIFSPLEGTVAAINHELLNHPEWLNQDCWEKGWLLDITPDHSNPELLTADQYLEYLSAAEG